MGSDILSPGKGLALCIQTGFKTVEEQLLENEVFQRFCCFQQNAGPPVAALWLGVFLRTKSLPPGHLLAVLVSLFPQDGWTHYTNRHL